VTFYGADTDQLRDQGGRTTTSADRLTELLSGLSALVSSVEWVGPDADAFRQRWEAEVRSTADRAATMLEERGRRLDQDAEEQDEASGGGDGGDATPWERFLRSLQGEGHMESDGFFGDLLGGPESGMLGNIAWNSLGAGVDVVSMIPGLGLPATIAGLAMDIPSIGIGLYDMAQSFQDGDLFGTIDGGLTAGINTLDAAAGILSVIPVTAPAGEIAGIFTSGLDALWSGATVAAQLDAINGGDHGGSTSRFLLEQIGVDSGLLDTADSIFGQGTEFVRDQLPFLDPMIDSSQLLVESVIPQGAQQVIENGATVVNDVIDDLLPW
jgi:hypothetical protein